MGERRKWDKQPSAHEPFVTTATTAAGTISSSAYDAASGTVDPVLEKQVQYIKMLEERNRLKKKLAASSKKDAREKQREDAFVTTFNVPATGAASGATATQDTVRKNKSSASLLPTKMYTQTSDVDRARGRSAPSTALPLRLPPRVAEPNGDDPDTEAKPERAVRRAKWSKPAVGEAFGVESRNGKARLCVGAKDDEAVGVAPGGAGQSGEEDEGASDDEYLEEEFEDFEAADDSEDEKDSADTKAVPSPASTHKLSPSEEKSSREATIPTRAEAKQPPSAAVSTVDASASAGLSRTTTDLFSVIQNLSRSKQKALVEVLQKFESSAQQESDIKSLQSSIGDPSIWKQVTSALFGSSSHEDARQHLASKEADDKCSGLTIAHVMEEQRKWEEDYARQMQQRLAEEREAKEKVMREAEQRRLLLMQQMDEEEKELERLMEQKRQQRLAKMKALEQEDEVTASTGHHTEVAKIKGSKHGADVSVSSGKKPVLEKVRIPEVSEIPAEQQAEEAKPLCTASENNDSGTGQTTVPKLNLPSPLSSTWAKPSPTELRLRLLSTWGKTRAVGLTQICAYDVNGDEIMIDASAVKIYEQTEGRPLPKSHEMMRTLPRLFNGIAQTNNDQDMWLGRLSDHGMLEIAFEIGTPPSKLCVWNYNSKMCSACARDVEVLLGGRSVWSGSLPQGFGDEDDSICTWISVGHGAKKTARIATSRPSVDQGKPALRASFHETKSVRQGGSVTSSGDEAGSSSASGPIWLSASRSTHSLSTSKHEVNKAEAKEALIQDLEVEDARANASGSLTSRRPRGEPSDHGAKSARVSVGEDRSDYREAKAGNPTERITRDEFLARKDRERRSGTGAFASSWDSLEHFSKTSRSRLPSATEDVPQEAFSQGTTELVKASFVPTTTSSLLTELRGATNHSSFSPAGTSTSEQPASVHFPIEIPELPTGRRLKLEIVSTWGDQYYVGLNGIEVFDQRGKLVSFTNPDSQIVACPPSINVLDEYEDDPRVAKNLVDGIYCTCDDFHMWLAPYTQGEDHHVMLSFDQSTSVSMVRIWNYNKSRAHTYRGVRHIRLMLLPDSTTDRGRLIFEGEIKRAPGGLIRDEDSESAMWCEVILFTTDHSILKKIELNDALLRAYGQEQEEEEATTAIVSNVRSSMELRRPKTADKGSDTNNSRLTEDKGGEMVAQSRSDADKRRPVTSAKRVLGDGDLRKSIDTWVVEEPQQKSPVLIKVTETKEDSDEDDSEHFEGLLRGRQIILRLLSTWGDRNYIGLTQIEVLVGNHGTPIPLDLSNIDASPRDLATLGYTGDPRTLDKLINGVGTTCDDANMWLVPFGSAQEIRIDLKKEQYIYGIRVWNYNKSLEDSFRGVKQLAVMVDGELISPRQTGFVLRKAPGRAYFDFDQILRFGASEIGDKRDRAYVEKIAHPVQNRTYKTPNVKQDYEPVLFPQGFVLKLVLWATWGDPYYVGLNGIELYDSNGKKITAKPSTVTAQPHSLADIDQQGSPQDDVRVPENLLSGKNKNTWDASDTWLAPLASSLGISHGNIVFIVFDTPIVLSLIKFWNYSKTPERGAKDMDIYLDDVHIFSGSLRKAPHGNGGQNVGRFGPKHLVVEEFSQPVLFSTNQAQVDAEKRRVYYCGSEEQDVLCINEGQVVQESKAMYRKPDPGAEGVVVDLAQRPMTAMGRK